MRERAGHSGPDDRGNGCGRGGFGHRADRDLPGRMAGVPVVEPAARTDHCRPGRLPGAAARHRLRVARGHRGPPNCCGGVPVGVHGRHPRDAAGRDQALPVRHLGRSAVPHRVPDPAHREPGTARHDLRRHAAVLPGRLVLDRRPGRCADRYAGLGDVQAVGHHLHRDRGGAGDGVVVGADSLRVRADRHHRHRRGDPGLQLARALRRDHHRAHPAGTGAGVVRTARARQGKGAGRPSPASGCSSASPPPSTPCCSAMPPSRWG